MKTTTPEPKKKRVINTGAKSPVGQARSHLYRHTLARIKEATQAGFALEAITLLESVISDRIEARLEAAGLECEGKKSKFRPLGKMIEALTGAKSPDDAADKEVYARVGNWAGRRNKALHAMAKFASAEDATWDEKYSTAKQAATDGLKLFRELDSIVKRLNRPRVAK
jgi:hypothetical protein